MLQITLKFKKSEVCNIVDCIINDLKYEMEGEFEGQKEVVSSMHNEIDVVRALRDYYINNAPDDPEDSEEE